MPSIAHRLFIKYASHVNQFDAKGSRKMIGRGKTESP